jgi:hypothetical protein
MIRGRRGEEGRFRRMQHATGRPYRDRVPGLRGRGGEGVGAVHGYMPRANALVVYTENAGGFVIPLEAVQGVHDGKVVVDIGRVDAVVRRAIAHAHDREEPGA